jgi:adenine deaminase
MCLCTDDRNPLDIAEEGHLDHMIRRLIELGSPPLAVYRAASLSAAEAFGLKDRGLIAPGKRADIVAIDGLETCTAHCRLGRGPAVTRRPSPRGQGGAGGPALRQGAGLVACQLPRARQPGGDRRHRHPRGQDHHRAPARDDPDRRWRQAPRPGARPPAHRRDRAARQERQHRHRFRARLRHAAGAIAATVCHDHHNIACVGVDYADMAAGRARLGEIEGGFVVVRDGRCWRNWRCRWRG